MFKKITLITFLLIFNFKFSYAEIPHYLDFKLTLNESVAGKKAQQELKQSLNNQIKNLKNKEKKLQDEEKKIIEQKKLLSAEEYKKKVNSLRSKVSILKKERNQMLSNMAQKKEKARSELLKNLNPIIKKYMVEKKIRMVIDKKALILADEKLDITKDIIKMLNKDLKSIKLN